MPQTLIPDWPFLDKILRDLQETPDQKIPLRLWAGLPYLCLRLALAGRSVLVCADESRTEILSDDVKALAGLFDPLKGVSIGTFPENAPRETSILLEEADSGKPIIWFGTRAALTSPILSKAEFAGLRQTLKVGQVLSYSKFIERLCVSGYVRVNFVEEVGEFASRGEVFDFWTPNHEKPVRMILSGDVVESMNFFDTFTQRTEAFLAETSIVPLVSTGASGRILEHLPRGTVIVMDGGGTMETGGLPVLEIDPAGADPGMEAPIPVRLDWKIFKGEVLKNSGEGIKNFVLCRNMGEVHRLEDILHGLRLPADGRPEPFVAPCSQGFFCRPLKLCAWTFAELVGASLPERRVPKFKTGRVLDSLTEIRPGDYVVHELSGIGRYRGLEKIAVSSRGGTRGKESEFLALEFHGGDRLLVPIQDFKLIQKYIGSEGKKPKLYSLDSAAWERVKQRVRKEVQDIAQDLIKTAAARASASRVHQPDRAAWETLYQEFVEAFPYEETPDQMAAIEAVEQDMDAPKLMDRLICGDVGYGKTEVAMRAAFRAVCESKQAALLVPTTILAEQHFKTFSNRFASFPVKIGMLSRFQTAQDQKQIITDAAAGRIDILIGTHRLIQKDVSFKNLGLVMIDEEHRFGVKQKESLKKMKLNADMLSLSATPIPRTLSLSFGGVRDISVIETPPEGRLPIDTWAGPFDEEKLEAAIKKELDRNGQIFYVHNQISSITARKQFLERIFPGLKIGIAHGQMTADELESAMWHFCNRRWDMLLSTTIIESGLDIPNVNTLIVEDSDEFGLAQLYQLRGRVGRQKQKAYCYLFFSGWGGLSEDARKRLDAIQEFSALGSGMKLALRDLQIRGMGNFLGSQQHGWISAVGLDFYCQLLGEEVERLKHGGARRAEDAEVSVSGPEVELSVAAFIPDSYVDSPGERIALYKKMLAIQTGVEMDSMKAELAERFGPEPKPLRTLFELMALRLEAQKLHIASIVESSKGFVLAWKAVEGRAPVDVVALAQAHPDLIEIFPTETGGKEAPLLRILFKWDFIGDSIPQTAEFLRVASKYVILQTL